jgi:predicted nucleic acid-binding protein
MASIKAFLDTSGFYALLVKEEKVHNYAAKWMAGISAERPLLATTDLVLSETATLLKARGYRELLSVFFDFLASTSALRVRWFDPKLFNETRAFFLRHSDHGYSFVDAGSFVVMRQLGLTDALTTDRHFREAGFISLLPVA